MGRELVAKSVAFYRQTLKWAWTREEVQENTSRTKVLYFIVLYGSWFALMISVGVVLQFAGFTRVARSIWFFGVGFSAFMASIDIAWETATYLYARWDERTPDTDTGPDRELAWNLRPPRDVWIGFLVTTIALIVLIMINQLLLTL